MVFHLTRMHLLFHTLLNSSQQSCCWVLITDHIPKDGNLNTCGIYTCHNWTGPDSASKLLGTLFSRGDLKDLWESIRVLHHTSDTTMLPVHSSTKSLPDNFASFIFGKIRKVYDMCSTSGSSTESRTLTPPAFSAFR